MDIISRLNKQLNVLHIFVISFFSMFNIYSFALTLELPTDNSRVVGQSYKTFLEPGQTLHELARKHNMGYQEIVRANQHINPRAPLAWSEILIPSQFILPNTKQDGIIINIPEMRLYYFPDNTNTVVTFPIAVGRSGWETPTGLTKIIAKKENPKWYVPKSIQKHMAKKGVILPNIVEAGPDNPLGKYAMRLQIPGYLIHGTNQPYSIGKKSSSGCIRMYPEDIEALFMMTPVGEEVRIINAPYNTSWHHNRLYVEFHKPYSPSKHNDAKLITELQKQYPDLNWNAVDVIRQQHEGYPHAITKEL